MTCGNSTKRRQKQRLVEVSIDLFAAHGINRVSLESIASEVGASRGMIYHYFEDGKPGIVSEILRMFESCVCKNTPDPAEWEPPKADAKNVLSRLFFTFPDNEAIRYHKILRIILSEMFNNRQVKEYILNQFILGREQYLSNCFKSLACNGRIAAVDAESAARFLNHLLFVYAVIDALTYPDVPKNMHEYAVRDCGNFMRYLLRAT